MNTFEAILKKEESQEALLAQLKVAWESIADDKKAEMLHAKDNVAFIMACQSGHQKIAAWLWTICPDEEQKAMLHAHDDNAFAWACGKGHIEAAKWLWG